MPRTPASRPSPLPRLRKLCLALPEAHEVEAWGAPTFRVKNKLFAMYADARDHHGGGRNGVWCKAQRANQELMVRAAPDRFFVPPYVGPSGWVGDYLDGATDWHELAELLRDAFRLVAPKKIGALLDAPPPAPTAPASPPRRGRPSPKGRAGRTGKRSSRRRS